MKVFLAALVLVGAGVFGMCFNILFRKKDFPQSDIGANEQMRSRGIRCFKEEDAALHSDPKKEYCYESCSNCGQTECREIHALQQARRDASGDSR